MTAMGETVLCRYRYDPLDRLIGHIPSDTSERQRFYCKSKLTTEIQGATRYSIVQHGDLLLAQQRNEGDATESALLATDQQRSVLQSVKINHPPQPIAYSPYGHRPIVSGLLSLLGFNGERPDPVTGHYLLGNGYRAFNPVLMRFNSPDSLSPFGRGGLNPYVYCGGDPRNRTDATGHNWMKVIKTLVSQVDIPNATRIEWLNSIDNAKNALGGRETIEKLAKSSHSSPMDILLTRVISDKTTSTTKKTSTLSVVFTAKKSKVQTEKIKSLANKISANYKTSEELVHTLGNMTPSVHAHLETLFSETKKAITSINEYIETPSPNTSTIPRLVSEIRGKQRNFDSGVGKGLQIARKMLEEGEDELLILL